MLERKIWPKDPAPLLTAFGPLITILKIKTIYWIVFRRLIMKLEKKLVITSSFSPSLQTMLQKVLKLILLGIKDKKGKYIKIANHCF